jgi:hypothetical protein
MILVSAGRRVDAPDSEDARFPLDHVGEVKKRVRRMLEKERPTAVVCSAACGADLIALGEAAELGITRRVVLPFASAEFRETSVTDRPGDWGPPYDRVIHEVKAGGNLVVLERRPGEDAYLAANRAIFEEGMSLANRDAKQVVAALIWDGKSRGEGDVTEQFGSEARRRGFRVIEVRTV